MTLLEWALTYARRGWPVFPCSPATKRPLVKGDVGPDGKEIPNTGGVKKATTDEATIRAWWGKWPKAMIGLACGPAAGVWVLDGDAGEARAPELGGGIWTVDDIVAGLEAHLGVALTKTWTVATPRGGRHWYYQCPADDPLGNSRGALPPKAALPVDVRGQGGYVILPPSARDSDGVAYQWLVKPRLADELPAKASAELSDCLHRRGRWEESTRVAVDSNQRRKHRERLERAAGLVDDGIALMADVEAAVQHYGEQAMGAEIARLRDSVKGTRNENLFHAAIKLAQLAAAGAIDRGVALAELESVIAGWPNVRKSRTTIESGWSKGWHEPRDLSEVRAKAADRARRSGSARAEGAAGAPSDLPMPSGPEDYGLPSEPASPAWRPPAWRPPAGAGALPAADDFGATLPNGKDAADRPDTTEAGRGGEPPEDPDALALRLAWFPLTDLGNAERYRERERGRLMSSVAFGWLWWDEQRWNRDGAESKARVAVHRTVRSIKDEARALRESDQDFVIAVIPGKKGAPDREVRYSDKVEEWAKACEFNARMAKIADDAAPYLSVAPHELDADRFAINVANGTLHVGRRADGSAFVRFAAHDPADKITKLAPVVYDPKATCPHYDRFLEQVQPKPEMRRFLHQWGGYSLTGDVSEQRLVFFYGMGRNGKSTLVDVWGQVFGDYGTMLPIETFLNQGTGKRGDQASPDLAMLKGRRFVRTSEPDKGAKLGEALIKLVTGGEPFLARELHKPFFILHPEFKLTISGNHKPDTRGTDLGLWRRMTLVPWVIDIAVGPDGVIDMTRIDKSLPGKLAGETSGILNRLLDGLRDWLENGLIIPADVATATEDYRREMDPLGRFLDACVVSDPGGRVQSSELHKVFAAWCKANGEREWTPTGFGRAMSDRGFVSHKSNVTWWQNIRLVKTVKHFVDDAGNPVLDPGEPDKGGGGAGGGDDVVPL